MSTESLLERLLNSYKRYYNVKIDDVSPPFIAEAEFHSHNEQYFLVKAAKIADIDSNEYVFFADTRSLSIEQLEQLSSKAWDEGLSRINPCSGHKSSDVILIILADNIEENVQKQINKTKFYKSYLFSFHGWSHFRLVVADLSTKKTFSNTQGRDIQKTLQKLLENKDGS